VPPGDRPYEALTMDFRRTPNGVRTRAAALKVSLSRADYQGCNFKLPGQEPFLLTTVYRRRPLVTTR
jgi:hypothetical protein